MLESKLNMLHWCYINILPTDELKSLAKRGLDGLIYLLLPEDTSGNAGSSNNDFVGIGSINIASTFKAGVWIAISIAVSLMVGQLQ